MSERELYRIAVDPAPKPVYVKGEMYLCNGNQKRKLTVQEAVAYEKRRGVIWIEDFLPLHQS